MTSYPPSGTAQAPTMPAATGYPAHQGAPSQGYLPSSQPIMPPAGGGQSQQVTIPAEVSSSMLQPCTLRPVKKYLIIEVSSFMSVL